MKTERIETITNNEPLRPNPKQFLVPTPGVRCAFQWPASAASFATALSAIFMAVLSVTAHSETVRQDEFTFVNAVDDTQGFSFFGSMPAINNAGDVAFEATGPGFELGSVWRWKNGRRTLVATSADGKFRNFGDNVVINAAGRVGFNTRVVSGNDTIIAIGDGDALNTIASANEQGLAGGGVFGLSAMNERGTVVFTAFRQGFRSQEIFTGSGGPLTPRIDTATDSTFVALGNTDINAAGLIVFGGFLADGTEGLFLIDGGVQDLVDTTDPRFVGFLDPVINQHGTVATGAFLSDGGMAVITATPAGVTPRTTLANSPFALIDNVTINNAGDLAFFATETSGGDGIFVELTGGTNPVPVIETGDPLFGSRVVALSNGRFSLNDSDQVTFQYRLADGRSGIAIASRRH